MKWKKIPLSVRLLCIVMSIGGFYTAWYLQKIGASGIEDVPPPFILAAGLFGIGSLLAAIFGRLLLPVFKSSQHQQEK